MALQLLELPNHTIISRRFARWVGVPMHRTIAAVKFAKVQPPRRRSKSCFFHSNPVCKFFYSCRVPRNPEMDLHVTEEEADELCLYRFQQYSRTFIRSWILQGKLCVDGKVVNKAGTPVSDKALVQIIAEVPKYSRKLEAAIEQLGIDVSGKVALDSGLSTFDK